MRTKIFVLSFFLFVFSVASASAATYYVSPSGNDSNNGSSSSPFRTIKKGMDTARAGDTVEVLSGTYPGLTINQSGSSGNPIKLKGNNATISGGHRGLDVTGSHLEISGFTVVEAVSHGVHITGKNIKVFDVIARNNVTENRGSGGTCGSSSGWGSGFSVKKGAENITLENIQVYQNCGEGLAITRVIGAQVTGAIVYDNFSVNIYPDNSKDVLIQNSISYCTGDARFNRNGQRAAGINIGEEDYSKWGDPNWGSKLENVSLINNIVHSCHSGIKLSSELNYGLRGGLIAHNTIVGIIGSYGIRIISMPYNNNIRVYNNITAKTPTFQGSGIQSGNNVNTTTFATTPNPTNPASFMPAGNANVVNTGTSVGVNRDFLGNSRPQGSAPDIGAMEVGGSTTSPTPTPTPTGAVAPSPTPTPTPSPSPTPTPTGVTPTPTPIEEGERVIQHLETLTATATGNPGAITLINVPAVADQLYLATVSTKNNSQVASVTGLGLNWQLAAAACGGRAQTRTEVWYAMGNPTSSGGVTANFVQNPSEAVLAVSRYSGVNRLNPLGNTIAFNSTQSGANCSGGTDQSSYQANIAMRLKDSMVFVGVGKRQMTHAPGQSNLGSYQERADFSSSTGGNAAGLAISDLAIAAVTDPSQEVSVLGSFSSAVDYSAVAVEIFPESDEPLAIVKPGDGNGDGQVDGIDFYLWRVHYNQNVTGGPSQGDFDRSGRVDGIDFVIWKNNYGK